MVSVGFFVGGVIFGWAVVGRLYILSRSIYVINLRFISFMRIAVGVSFMLFVVLCSDGHDQIMIEFCSTMICSISLDHGVRRSIMGTARSYSTIIEYTRASGVMPDHSAILNTDFIINA